jgi:hypothetical protein
MKKYLIIFIVIFALTLTATEVMTKGQKTGPSRYDTQKKYDTQKSEVEHPIKKNMEKVWVIHV